MDSRSNLMNSMKKCTMSCLLLMAKLKNFMCATISATICWAMCMSSLRMKKTLRKPSKVCQVVTMQEDRWQWSILLSQISVKHGYYPSFFLSVDAVNMKKVNARVVVIVTSCI